MWILVAVVLELQKKMNNFYYIGRSDGLRGFMPNPLSRGTSSTEEYNSYMNGYNSVSSNLGGKIDLREILKKSLEDKLKKKRLNLTPIKLKKTFNN